VSESVGRCNVEKADHRHPRLLRAGGERPTHSITSSARAMSGFGCEIGENKAFDYDFLLKRL
jgi:hypothetical protein